MTSSLTTGAIIHDRYRIVRAIGKGGMGAVYEAVDTRLGNTVALKQTLVAGEELDAAFGREARLLASLRHAALPVVSDYFVEGDARFLVMQYIPGDDFGAMLERRTAPFALDEVLRWGDQLLDALDYLHTQQPPIIHRDIKPQNLKLTPRGEIVLLDFGLAKSAAPTRTGTGSIFGYTPQYAPLEQIRGTGTDPRSDLYALAATLYHMLTNALPPNALDRAAAVFSGQPDPQRPLAELSPRVPPGVAAVIEQALAINADQRPASASAMRAALAAAVRSGSAGASTTPIEPAGVAPTMVAGAPQPDVAARPAATPRPASSRLLMFLGLGGVALLAIMLVVGGLAVSYLGRLTSRPFTPPPPTPVVEVDPAPTRVVEVDPPATAVVEIPPIPTIIIPTMPALPDIPAIPGIPGGQQESGLAEELLSFGGEGTGPGRFQDPRGVAIDPQGNIFVSDYITGRVQKFGPDGSLITSWQSEAETPILALAADRQGNVYVARATSVLKYSGDGEQLDEFTDGEDSGFDDLIVLADGSMLGIPWSGDSDVVRLDADGNEVERYENILEEGANADMAPARLAADGLGTLFILGDSGTDVFIFDSEGAFKDRFTVEGGWTFSDIAVDPQGRVLVSLFGGGVRVLSGDGKDLGTIGSPGFSFDMKFDDAGDLFLVTNQALAVKLRLK